MDITKEELQILVAKDEKPRRTTYVMILWGILDVVLFCAFCFGIVYYGVSKQWSNSYLRVLRFNDKGEFTIIQVGYLQFLLT